VDDHPALRRGLAEAIERTDDLEVAGEAPDIRTAKTLARESEPDVAIVDLTLGDENGLELIKDLVARDEDLSILVLSMHDESLYAERALRAGAKGYVMKDASLSEVLDAVRHVLKGGIHLSDRMADRLLKRAVTGEAVGGTALTDTLTDREMEVFELIGRGRRTREVAEHLHLSIKTVYTHCENIKRKLKLDDATQLHQQAFHWVHRERAGEMG
jgi:DNA-binding NarL/FixJ family response regulator